VVGLWVGVEGGGVGGVERWFWGGGRVVGGCWERGVCRERAVESTAAVVTVRRAERRACRCSPNASAMQRARVAATHLMRGPKTSSPLASLVLKLLSASSHCGGQ